MIWRVGALSAVAVLAVLAVSRTPASHALEGPGVIRITDRELASTRIDIGRPGRSAGDIEITRRLLYNTRITRRSIGRSQLVCVYTGTATRDCRGTYTLPAGSIMVSGPMAFRQFFVLAVVGGTGRYSNVRGTLTVTSLGRRPRRDVVLFRLTV